MSHDRDGPRGRDRGLSNTIGFIILFSFLILGFTIYQGVVVPQQNRATEFEHSQSVQGQLQDLRNAVQNAAGGRGQSVAVRLGPVYPERTLASNLAPATGNLRTTGLGGSIVVSNVTPLDDETGDYFNDSEPTLGPYGTTAVQYRPHYGHYTNAPTTVYENTVAYNRFGNGANLSLTDQGVVDGRRITLVALNGSLAESRAGTVSVDAEPLSATVEPLAVTNASAGPARIVLPTRLGADDWRDLLADELDTPGADDRYVTSVASAGPGRVAITFEAGVTYELQLARVGVGADRADPGPHYVTAVAGDDTSIAEGGSQQLVVEVRDRYNNPVSNVSVASSLATSAGPGDTVTPGVSETDGRGRATFTYQAPGNVDDAQSATVNVSFGAGDTERHVAGLDVEVLDADGSGGGSCSDDPGTGGDESWCSTAPTTTVSQPGGVISGVGSVSSIVLADPSFSSIRPDDGSVRTASERFRLVFVIEEDVADTTGTTRYLFAVPDTNMGFNQDLDNTGTTVQNRGVVVYKDASTNQDGVGWETHVSASLRQGELDTWYDGGQEIDLLDSSHYASSVQTELDEVATFMTDNEVRIYVVDMDGRVDIRID